MLKVTPEIRRHLTANMEMKRKDILLGNFLGGLAWGAGTVVGASLLVVLLGFILNILGVFAGISEIINRTNELNKQLPPIPRLR